jgi:hypothetical protein
MSLMLDVGTDVPRIPDLNVGRDTYLLKLSDELVRNRDAVLARVLNAVESQGRFSS